MSRVPETFATADNYHARNFAAIGLVAGSCLPLPPSPRAIYARMLGFSMPRPALAWGLLLAVVSGCGGGGVTPAMVNVAKKRWPDASAESLERGHALYKEKCKVCHALPPPKEHTPEEWPKILDKMAKLAELDPAEKESVLRYLIAAREVE